MQVGCILNASAVKCPLLASLTSRCCNDCGVCTRQLLICGLPSQGSVNSVSVLGNGKTPVAQAPSSTPPPGCLVPEIRQVSGPSHGSGEVPEIETEGVGTLC